MELLLEMDEIDESIIKHGMECFGLSRDEVLKELKELVNEGFLIPGIDNFQLSSKGIEYVEKTLLKKSTYDKDSP